MNTARLDAVATGGEVRITDGAHPENLTMDKAATLSAPTGIVTIGD